MGEVVIKLGKKMQARLDAEAAEEARLEALHAERLAEEQRRAALPDEVLTAKRARGWIAAVSCGQPCACREEGGKWWCRKAAAKAKGTLRYENDFGDCLACV